ncbi:MAG: tRNA threonylcarbamoyladenosine dehydratase [Betaproteobacteria bacterium]
MAHSFTPQQAAGGGADLQRRFGGLARLYGPAGAQAIAQAHVVVVGIGGVGSWAAEALARSAVARLTLIDLDHIAESNVNRQVHALSDTLGQAKVQAMRERIAQIHPGCQVDGIEAFVDASNWPALAAIAPDHPMPLAVIDACDQVRAKVAMAAWALDTGVPFVCVGAAGGKRHAHRVDLADLAEVTHDPLLAQLRYQLRKHHQAPRSKKIGLSCVFSREAVVQPGQVCEEDAGTAADGSLNCHGYGSSVSVTATFGMCAAGWVLDTIAKEAREKITL